MSERSSNIWNQGLCRWADAQQSWRVVPGLHSGITCSKCGKQDHVMYRVVSAGLDFCGEHRPGAAQIHGL